MNDQHYRINEWLKKQIAEALDRKRQQLMALVRASALMDPVRTSHLLPRVECLHLLGPNANYGDEWTCPVCCKTWYFGVNGSWNVKEAIQDL
jgi:hypothetical protein